MVAMTDLAIDAGLFSDELRWFLDIHHSIELPFVTACV